MNLFNANDDWQEQFRRFWYPKLHSLAERLGLFTMATAGPKQFTGTVRVPESELETILVKLGFERNPIAALKTNKDGRTSTGSWVLRSHDDQYGMVSKNRQLHITMFENEDGGLDLYAHNEYDWQDKPFAHLQSKNIKYKMGADDFRYLLDNYTYLNVTN